MRLLTLTAVAAALSWYGTTAFADDLREPLVPAGTATAVDPVDKTVTVQVAPSGDAAVVADPVESAAPVVVEAAPAPVVVDPAATPVADEPEVSIETPDGVKVNVEVAPGAEEVAPAPQPTVVVATPNTVEANRWRYKRHKGEWWYWHPSDYWVYWRGGQWIRYRDETYQPPVEYRSEPVEPTPQYTYRTAPQPTQAYYYDNSGYYNNGYYNDGYYRYPTRQPYTTGYGSVYGRTYASPYNRGGYYSPGYGYNQPYYGSREGNVGAAIGGAIGGREGAMIGRVIGEAARD